jgi:hypothetical protein
MTVQPKVRTSVSQQFLKRHSAACRHILKPIFEIRSCRRVRLDHCSDAKQYWRATLALTFALVCVTSAVGALAAIL